MARVYRIGSALARANASRACSSPVAAARVFGDFAARACDARPRAKPSFDCTTSRCSFAADHAASAWLNGSGSGGPPLLPGRPSRWRGSSHAPGICAHALTAVCRSSGSRRRSSAPAAVASAPGQPRTLAGAHQGRQSALARVGAYTVAPKLASLAGEPTPTGGEASATASGAEAFGEVVSRNLKRRHLDEGQRAWSPRQSRTYRSERTSTVRRLRQLAYPRRPRTAARR